ncbi:triacylglycerol lipase 2 [Medicago truncatula]|uniref:Lipase n=1 Tax=Medicago truncatula TaxID=3880 RepID=A0A072U8N5_MEDTR|nr:triacylglycerol lipase 2 [Medicago truncatula]KEH25746.1 triacylglycerol lipase-like protein [Medicago truncatula]
MARRKVVNLFSIVMLCITIVQGRKTINTSNEFSASSLDNNDDGICKSMVETQGYTCEEHKATTSDGFILSIQRLPAGQSGKKANKPPVLIHHGLFCDGVSWLLNSPNESLPFILADSGFDVWLVSGRGSKYSSHSSLTPKDLGYWDWSWDELASNDLPASMQYVYDHTSQKIHYVGHSQGSLIAFVAFSQGKLLNITRSAALLSPIAHMSHITSKATKLAAEILLADYIRWLGIHVFLPTSGPGSDLLNLICVRLNLDCVNLLSIFTGPNCCLNTSRVQYYLEHVPQPTSTKNLIHFSQMIRRGTIAMYDYGIFNWVHYGQLLPPDYDFSKIPNDLPLFLGIGKLDMLSDEEDVNDLLNFEFKNHDADKLMKVVLENYAHADFILGVKAKQDVYDPMIDFFNAH